MQEWNGWQGVRAEPDKNESEWRGKSQCKRHISNYMRISNNMRISVNACVAGGVMINVFEVWRVCVAVKEKQD